MLGERHKTQRRDPIWQGAEPPASDTCTMYEDASVYEPAGAKAHRPCVDGRSDDDETAMS